MRSIVTLFGIGYSPLAPGTAGSAVAVITGLFLHLIFNDFYWFLSMTLVIALIGTLATSYVVQFNEDEDPSEIVVDELIGQWIAMWPISWCYFNGIISNTEFILCTLLSFALFRAFDIYKPFPISWADKQHGAFGIMADDILAGLASAVVISLLIYLWTNFV